jgi:hypothetical protein
MADGQAGLPKRWRFFASEIGKRPTLGGPTIPPRLSDSLQTANNLFLAIWSGRLSSPTPAHVDIEGSQDAV